MKSTIILVLALCIGCKDRTPEKIMRPPGRILFSPPHDSEYVYRLGIHEAHLYFTKGKLTAWGIATQDFRSAAEGQEFTDSVMAVIGRTGYFEKKDDFGDWKVDTIQWRSSGSIWYTPPLGYDVDRLEKDLKEFERLFRPKHSGGPEFDYSGDTADRDFPTTAINFYNDTPREKEPMVQPILDIGGGVFGADSGLTWESSGRRLYIGKDTASYQGFGKFNGDADYWNGKSLKADSLYLYALPTGRRICDTDSLANLLIKKKKDSL